MPRRHVGRASALCAWVPRHVARGGGRVPRPPRPRAAGAPRRAAAALAIGRVEPRRRRPARRSRSPSGSSTRAGAPVGAEAPAAGPVVAIVSAAAVGPGGRGAPLLGARTSAARGTSPRSHRSASIVPARRLVAAAGPRRGSPRDGRTDPLDAAVGASPGGRCAAALVDAARCPPRGAAADATGPAPLIARVPAGALVARGRSPAAHRCSPPRASAATRPPGLPGPG